MAATEAQVRTPRPTSLRAWTHEESTSTRGLGLTVTPPFLRRFLWLLLPGWMVWVFVSLYHDDTVAAAATLENGFLQNVTVAAYLLATGLFAHAGTRECGPDVAGPRHALILLAAGSLFVALEEVNWGQSVLHFATPAALEHANLQQEVSLHNLELPGPFAGRHWANLVLWGLTVMGGVLLPASILFSSTVRDWLQASRLPIPPALTQAYWFGAAAIPMDGELLGQLSRDNIPSELREVTVSVAVTIWAWAAWTRVRASR